jgi:hypothetical protein
MRGGGGSDKLVQGSVRVAAVILALRHLASVGDQIPAADVVVLADLRATEPGELRLRLIGAGAVVLERDAMVDPLHFVASVQLIP